MPSSRAGDRRGHASDQQRLQNDGAEDLGAWEAPIVRSSPNSVVRCATVIENVLKMMKPPTNSAMPANASNGVLRKPRLFWIDSVWSSVAC